VGDSPAQRIVAEPSATSTDMDTEVVVLHMSRGRYHGLNEVAGQVWKWVQEPRTRDELLDLLLAEFDVDPEQAAADLDALLDDLRARDLVVAAP
jgi:PqqD family protein of HPr-rel-A system